MVFNLAYRDSNEILIEVTEQLFGNLVHRESKIPKKLVPIYRKNYTLKNERKP
jgi:hypothetical protein